MKHFFLLLILILLFLNTSAGVSSDEATYLSKYLELLDKGNEKEKKLALIELPNFLRYPAIQKDKNIFIPIFRALEDKNPCVRETAAACLKQFGKNHQRNFKKRDFGMERIPLLKEQIKKHDDPRSKEQALLELSYHEVGEVIVFHLIKALTDREPTVRSEVAKALAYYKDERATDELVKRLNDQDLWVRLNAVFALGEIQAGKATDSLLNLLEVGVDWRNKFVQQESVIAIRKIGTPEVAVGLGGGVFRAIPGRHRRGIPYRQEQPEVSKTIMKVGGFDEQTTSKVASVLIRKSEDPYLRTEIIKAILQFRTPEGEEVLLKATQDSNEEIRKLAIDGLLWKSGRKLGEFEMVETEKDRKTKEQKFDIIKKSLRDPSVRVRASAVAALGRSGDERVVDLLIETMQDSDDTVKRNAITALGQSKDEEILDSLIPFFGSSTPDLRRSAVEAFMSVVQKTYKEMVYVYRVGGVRHTNKDIPRVPGKVQTSRRMVHPMAVEKLINLFNRSNQQVILVSLDLFPQFEDRRIEEVLLKLLSDPSPQLRGRAISLLPNFSDNSVVPRLIEASKDKDNGVRRSAVWALGQFQDMRGLESLKERLNDPVESVRVSALEALGGYSDPNLLDLYLRSLKDPSIVVRRAAIARISERGDERALETMILFLNDPDSSIAGKAAKALGVIGSKRAVDPLVRALKGALEKNGSARDTFFKRSAVEALGLLKDKRAVPLLLRTFEEKELQQTVIEALGLIEDRQAVPILMKYVSGKEAMWRDDAIKALGEIGDPSVLDTFETLLQDNQFPRKRILIEAIANIGNDKALEILIKCLLRYNSEIDYAVIDSLGNLKNKQAIKPLVETVGKSESLFSPVTDALKKYELPEMVDILAGYLRDENRDVRKGAVIILGEFGDRRAIEPLKKIIKDSDPEISFSAERAIKKISGTFYLR